MTEICVLPLATGVMISEEESAEILAEATCGLAALAVTLIVSPELL